MTHDAYLTPAHSGKLRVMRLLAIALVGVLLVAACGDDAGPAAPPPPANVDEVIAKLNAIPGVTAEEKPTSTAGYSYVVVHFTQPVDHTVPDGDTFQMEASLLFGDGAAPMIVQTSGYWDYYLDRPVELTKLLHANQISIEHRYFHDSRPANPDWTKLTIRQMADDEHAIIAALHTIFPGAFITTGASKGGMTTVYHRRFYPDDVAGSVPYVAPISFGAPDTRYDAFVASIGPADCRQKLRDLATEMLANRRAAMEQFAANDGHTYTRVPIGPAVEVAIESLEWAFWQYRGEGACGEVPATTATDDEMWSFLAATEPVSDSDDASCADFEPYYYQAYYQLGFPDDAVDYLHAYDKYTDADFYGILPTPEPPFYDHTVAMNDIAAFARSTLRDAIFVYGEWDPWSGGAFHIADSRIDASKRNVMLAYNAHGTHGSSLRNLPQAERDQAFALLEAWTGVTPTIPAAREAEPEMPMPRIPPALRRLR